MSKLTILALALGTAVALTVAAPTDASATAAFACDDDSGVCIDSGDASFTADKKSSSKDRNKRSTKSPGSLSVSIDGGRGSVFVNGRFVGVAPISGVEVPSGNNDLHVRDGETVLANGLLQVSKGASVSLTVRY